MIRASAIAIASLIAGCAHAPNHGSDNSAGFFGVANLKADGEICLHLRSEEPGLPVAEAYRCYKPSDPQYAMIREHVGSIAVGQEKVIAPFK